MPFLEGVLPIEKSRISTDVIAGVTLAALGIPEVMGYTKIAGMPVITGLYTILVPIAVFAVLGSSRHLVVGADSASAAIMAAGLAGMAAVASPQYVALAGIVAILTGAILLVARLVRLGFLADFLSRSVLIGFLTGVGIQVAMGQVAGMFGVPGGSQGNTVRKFLETLGQIPGQASWTTAAVSGSVLLVVVGLKFVSKKIPGALIAVIGAIWASYALDLSAHGVATLGHVPGGLPNFGIPSSGWGEWATLLPTAASIFLVVLAQSAATSRAYAAKYREDFDENVDLVGLALSNASAGLSGTFVVNGSPTKTEMVDGAGGRSQLSQLTTAAIVLIVLLFLTKPLQYMPEAVLASIVFLIGVELVDLLGMRTILRWRSDEFIVATVTAAVVVVVGVEQGILLAIVLSLLDHIRRSYRPRDTLLVRDDAGRWHTVPLPGPSAQAATGDVEPGLVIYRFGASLYYANANRFVEEIRTIVGRERGRPRWLCLEAGGIGDVDFSGGRALLDLVAELRDGGTRLVIADVDDDVRVELDRYGITEAIGADGLFTTAAEAVDAFLASEDPASRSTGGSTTEPAT
ncbi:MAG: SulP family inorganic anion transporter [Actinomycetota bacterium]